MTATILVVDDERDMQQLLKRSLEPAFDCIVETASSGESALQMLTKGRFDLVLADIKMPGMDGLEVLSAIKARNPDIQVILLTGHATLQQGIEAMKLGAMDFIEKPADIQVLTEKIKQAQSQKMILVEKRLEKKIKRIIQEKAW